MDKHENTALSHSLPVIVDGDLRCFGGTQMLLPRKSIRETGCGLISSANLMSYLTRFHGLRDGLFDRFAGLDAIPLSDFNGACMRICRGLLRPMPRLGMTGTAVAAGLNREFRRRGIPYRARWCFRGAPVLWERMAAMLLTRFEVDPETMEAKAYLTENDPTDYYIRNGYMMMEIEV